jgi:DNA-binding MarR family transcriptional regulator
MVALTAAGTEALARLGEPIAALTRDLLAPLDPEDLATTIRTLQAATARADALA